MDLLRLLLRIVTGGMQQYRPAPLRVFCKPVLKGLWDLVTTVINKVTILITTYNPNTVLITLLTKSPDPPSTTCLSDIAGAWQDMRAATGPASRVLRHPNFPESLNKGTYLNSRILV